MRQTKNILKNYNGAFLYQLYLTFFLPTHGLYTTSTSGSFSALILLLSKINQLDIASQNFKLFASENHVFAGGRGVFVRVRPGHVLSGSEGLKQFSSSETAMRQPWVFLLISSIIAIPPLPPLSNPFSIYSNWSF